MIGAPIELTAIITVNRHIGVSNRIAHPKFGLIPISRY